MKHSITFMWLLDAGHHDLPVPPAAPSSRRPTSCPAAHNFLQKVVFIVPFYTL